MQYKCVILDDEPIAADIIQKHLEKIDDIEVIAVFNKPLEAMKFLNINQADLLFLDIEMPTLSGLEVLKTLPNPPKVIFTTAHREYAVEAFDLEVLDYLLKPISFNRFIKAINRFYNSFKISDNEKIEKRLDIDSGHIIVKSNKRYHKIYYSDILFIESLDDFIRFHLKNGKLDCYERLLRMEEKLPNEIFIRIHRAYIINIQYVNSFTATSVQISNEYLPVGKNYRDTTKKKLNTM